MNKITRIIGSIIVTVLLYAIPIITTCAFTFGWDAFIAYLLTVMALAELACLFILIWEKAGEGER